MWNEEKNGFGRSFFLIRLLFLRCVYSARIGRERYFMAINKKDPALREKVKGRIMAFTGTMPLPVKGLAIFWSWCWLIFQWKHRYAIVYKNRRCIVCSV